MLDVTRGPVDHVEINCRSKFHVVVPADLDDVEQLETIRSAFDGWLHARAERDLHRFGRRHDCGGDATPTAPTSTPTPVATSITLSVTSLSLASLGATSQLSATVKYQNGATMASATVTWTTSDAAVATVSSVGLVTSVADGTATITATSGSVSATASVSVEEAFYLAANGVTVICSASDMPPGVVPLLILDLEPSVVQEVGAF
jgi:uncharacterized protein YjdB